MGKYKVYNQNNVENYRTKFVRAIDKVFGDYNQFFDFLEEGKYNFLKYDVFIYSDEENYIINRETGRYINWYKLYHLGRDIHTNIHPTKIVSFLQEFKEDK